MAPHSCAAEDSITVKGVAGLAWATAELVRGGRPRHVLRVSGPPRLYTIDRFGQYERGLLELRFSPGVAAYAFTFG